MYFCINCHSIVIVCSDVSDKELECYVYVAVWDWDRISSNDYIGGMGLKVGDIISETCESQRVESWYKLLGDNISRKKSVRIITDEEAEKVCCMCNSNYHSLNKGTILLY